MIQRATQEAATQERTYSRYALEGLALLGKSIRLGRMRKRLTAQDLAERVGVSRSTLQRIEKGDPKVEIGLMFEAAAIVGVSLFDADEKRITALAERTDDRIALLPKHVYKAGKPVIDEF
ncbi:helix-turn-helix transcriptional regulator [Mycobacterium sp. KBS0706]|uniref:helix-turn-helix transcriptional regulator n=1 Tax=Mycobacterium sp. KBS0706 TaxID=2578109 RepID=UPI0027D2E505|nr:helix-turn-helix transcriptional regulator [Mycobacterium sp. KBS0706]